MSKSTVCFSNLSRPEIFINSILIFYQVVLISTWSLCILNVVTFCILKPQVNNRQLLLNSSHSLICVCVVYVLILLFPCAFCDFWSWVNVHWNCRSGIPYICIFRYVPTETVFVFDFWDIPGGGTNPGPLVNKLEFGSCFGHLGILSLTAEVAYRWTCHPPLGLYLLLP